MTHSPAHRPGRMGGHSPERAARHRHDQAVFRTLLAHHEAITRKVTELPDGILARTTSAEPELVALIHDHVAQMQRRMKEGFGLRHWDPAFREIFGQADRVRLQVTRLPDGVEIRQTSTDPNVVRLIHAHGAGVSAFVDEGTRAASKETPLPPEYARLFP